MPNPILKYQPTGGVTRSVGPVITAESGNGDEGTPILGYHPGGGSTGGIGTIGQRNGYLYYWPDIENLTGSVPQTDLEAQDISVLPSESLIIVITGVNGDETHWRRMPDPSSPITDLGLGIIVPINYDAETRPWVLLQELMGGGGGGTNAFGTVAIGGTNIVADSAPDTLTLVAGTNITLTPDAFADSITIATSSGGGSGTSMSSSVTQTIHGFAVGNVLRYTGTAYVKAQADVAANAEVVGLVTSVVDANNFTLTTGGAVTGLSGLTAGSVYFLSTTTAGLLTTTAPVATNQVSKPLLVATSATTGYFFNWRGWIVGSAAAIGGTPPNAYGTIRVAGQTDVVAATIPDILTLAAGTNITLTTNAATDTVTIAASGGGSTSTTGTGFWHNTTGVLDVASRAIDLSTADVTGNLDKAHLNSGTGATSSTFWRGDNTWATPAGGGNVSTSGTITTGQYPRWASATTLESVTPATVRTDLGLVIGTNVQAFDTDLTTWAGITPTTVGQSFVTLANPGAITFPEISATNVVSAKTAAQLKTDLSFTSADVGLGNVTNNAQTQAAIVPNTAPTSGQILIGNVGGTAYAKNSVSGSGATISLGATGVLTISAIPESSLSITNVTTGDATTAAHGFAPKGTVGTTQFWRQDWTLATPGGTGTVTATGGALTANSVVLGAGTTDTKVVAGIITDGTSKLTLGVSTTSVGSIALNNLTSGSVTIQPATGALSTATMTIPAGATNPVVADTGAANNFLTAISSAGVISKARPAIVSLSDAGTLATWAAVTPGTNVTTFLATPSSANLRGALTDENGTGAALFSGATTPDFTTGFTIGAAAASRKMIVGNATNFVPSTETWAVPGASTNNVLKSDGTNWTAAQLAFSNLSGSATAAQMPAFTGDVTSVAGATANTLVNIPTGTTIGGVAGTRGDVLYYGASGWAKLAAGTSGNQLTTNGAGADPTWAAPGAGGSGSPGGSTTQVQYNNAGAFAGITNATTDGTTLSLKNLTMVPTSGTTNSTINFGANYQAAAIILYNGGTSANWGWGMITNEMQFFVDAWNSSVHYAWTKGGDLQGSSTNELMRLNATTDALSLASGGVYGFSSTTDSSGTIDTALYRNAAGVVEINNGTANTYRDLMLRNLTVNGSAGGIQASSLDAGSDDLLLRNTGANEKTVLRVVPNGTVTSLPGVIQVFGTDFVADSTNYECVQLSAKGSADTYNRLYVAPGGTGVRGPLSISADGTNTQLVVGTSGGIGVGTATAGGTGVVNVNTGFQVGGAAPANYELTGNGTNFVSKASDIPNGSSAQQTGFSANTYLAGSVITLLAGDFKVGGTYRCMFDMAKTTAGTAAPVITIYIGTAGTTSDTAAQTITFAAATGVADTGMFEVWVNFRAVGASATISSVGRCVHNLAATGLTSTGASGSGTVSNSTSSTFNSTAMTKIGVAFNGGTSYVGTNNIVQAYYSNP